MLQPAKNYGVGTDDALKSVMLGQNTFITGPGGSGKSHLINTVRSMFPESTMIVAPTGVAALNVRGMTTYRAFGLSTAVSQEKDTKKVFTKQQSELLRSKELERIIIDEISMVRSDKLYEMDYKLRHFRRTDKPFGGLQVIAFGDGFQISPVLKNEERDVFQHLYGSEVPFGSWSWEAAKFENVILKEIFRQKSPEFAHHLNNMRMGRNIAEAVNYMNAHCYKPVVDPDAITLTNSNKLADSINQRQFESVKGTVKTYRAERTGEFKDLPVPEMMDLKVGLKVMITSNDLEAAKQGKESRYVNGTVGHIVGFVDDGVFVEIRGEKVLIKRKTWENISYIVHTRTITVEDEEGNPKEKVIKEIQEKPIGSYTALPIKLGYALTIHKAQGLTLDAVNIDLGYGAFTAGQAYVGISRATSTETLRLLKPLRASDIIVDPRIVNFYKQTFPGE